MAGAVFGDLGVSLFVAGAVFGEIWVAGARNVVIFNTKCVSEGEKYLVRLEGDACCSAHWK